MIEAFNLHSTIGELEDEIAAKVLGPRGNGAGDEGTMSLDTLAHSGRESDRPFGRRLRIHMRYITRRPRLSRSDLEYKDKTRITGKEVSMGMTLFVLT